MSGLARVLEKWRLDPDKKNDAERIEQWRVEQNGKMAHFAGNLWEDAELPDDAASCLADTLLKIATVSHDGKVES